MCKVLSGTQVPAECGNKDEPEITFRKLLLNQCQNHFEKNSEVELDLEARHKEIEEAAEPVSTSQTVFVYSLMFYVSVDRLEIARSA